MQKKNDETNRCEWYISAQLSDKYWKVIAAEDIHISLSTYILRFQ